MSGLYCLAILSAYSSNCSGYCDKVLVFEVGQHASLLNDGQAKCQICTSLLHNEASDWNLFFEFSKVDAGSMNSVVSAPIVKDMIERSMFVFFIANDNASIQMIKEIQREIMLKICIIVLNSTRKSDAVLNLDTEDVSGLSRIAFVDELEPAYNACVIDAISYAYLNRSLISVDIADLFAVLNDSLSVAILFKSNCVDCFDEFQNFLSEYRILLERSPGIFACLMYGKKSSCSVEHIDKCASMINKAVNRDAMLFYSADYKRQLDYEFGCTLLVNVL